MYGISSQGVEINDCILESCMAARCCHSCLHPILPTHCIVDQYFFRPLVPGWTEQPNLATQCSFQLGCSIQLRLLEEGDPVFCSRQLCKYSTCEGLQCETRYIHFVKFSGQATQTVMFMAFCIKTQSLKGILTAIYFVLTCQILPAGAG